MMKEPGKCVYVGTGQFLEAQPHVFIRESAFSGDPIQVIIQDMPAYIIALPVEMAEVMAQDILGVIREDRMQREPLPQTEANHDRT